MKRKRTWLLIVGSLVAVVLVLVLLFAPIFPYRPSRLLNPNDGWTPCDKWLTVEHCDRFEGLLEDDDEWHIRAGRRLVLIPFGLKRDRELTGNYSQKAEQSRPQKGTFGTGTWTTAKSSMRG